MSAHAELLQRADYGLDAPAVVRNLLVVSAIGLSVALGIYLGLIPATIDFGSRDRAVSVILLPMVLGPGIACAFTGLAMIWSSRFGKVRRRDSLLKKLDWTGAERVVDIGCGRGLMLIGAARHLTTGTATGVDIWRSEDLSNNSRDATLANAAAEGVADRVRVETADMRKLPFRDASIDLVVSCAAIHNLDKADDRAAAIREIVRVLRSGGRALIDDIRHYREYRREFSRQGCELVERLDNRIASALWTLVSFGSLRPATLLVEKRSA